MTIIKSGRFELTPEDIASLFCQMDNEQQAEFFNAVADHVRETWTIPFCFQMSEVRHSKTLTVEGLDIMKTIASYGD